MKFRIIGNKQYVLYSVTRDWKVLVNIIVFKSDSDNICICVSFVHHTESSQGKIVG